MAGPESMDNVQNLFQNQYEMENYGINKYLVHTGYTYHDGDELHIVLKIDDRKMSLTDEGHTLMWLSYEEFNMTALRGDMYQRILCENNVRDIDGRITVDIDKKENASVCLQSMIQALLQVADLRYLNRQTVSSTFVEDLIEESHRLGISDKCRYGEKVWINENDYCTPAITIDVKNPILVFAINTSDRAKDTLINIMLLKENKKKYRTIAVIDENATIIEKDKNRLINRVDRPILGLSEFHNVMEGYLTSE